MLMQVPVKCPASVNHQTLNKTKKYIAKTMSKKNLLKYIYLVKRKL